MDNWDSLSIQTAWGLTNQRLSYKEAGILNTISYIILQYYTNSLLNSHL